MTTGPVIISRCDPDDVQTS